MIQENLFIKLNQIEQELKLLGYWKKKPPKWIDDFSKKATINEINFMDWLQFIYLPNCRQHSSSTLLITPQATKFLGVDNGKEKLLQLLIELDAII